MARQERARAHRGGADLLVAFQIVTFVLGSFLGCILAIFALIVALGIIVLHIFAIIKGINGQRLIVPGISCIRRQILGECMFDFCCGRSVGTAGKRWTSSATHTRVFVNTLHQMSSRGLPMGARH